MKNKIFIILVLSLSVLPVTAFGSVTISCPGCQIIGTPPCFAPALLLYECSSQSDYDSRRVTILRTGTGVVTDDQITAQLQSCQDAINKYQADEQTYQNCLTDFNNSIKNLPVKPTCTASQHYNSVKNSCDCNSNYIKQSDGSCACPLNSSGVADTSITGSSCYCNNGYINYRGNCVDYNTNCQDLYGNNSYWGASGCQCSTGYQFNSTKTACVQITCYANSSLINNQCVCSDGFGWNSTQTACVKKVVAPVISPQPVNLPPVKKVIPEETIQPVQPTSNLMPEQINSIRSDAGLPPVPGAPVQQPKPQAKSNNIFSNIWSFVKNIFKFGK